MKIQTEMLKVEMEVTTEMSKLLIYFHHINANNGVLNPV